MAFRRPDGSAVLGLVQLVRHVVGGREWNAKRKLGIFVVPIRQIGMVRLGTTRASRVEQSEVWNGVVSCH